MVLSGTQRERGDFLGKMKGWQELFGAVIHPVRTGVMDDVTQGLTGSLQADVLTLLLPCLLVMQDQ